MRPARAVFCILVAICLLWVPVAAADPPADAFCVILIEPNADFTLIRVLVDENTSLEERAALWPSVDRDGNDVISPVEKDAFRWAQIQVFRNQSDLGVKAITLQPDAPYSDSPIQEPLYATLWRQVGHVFHHQDYALPERLTSTAELETQEVREFGFELEPQRSSRFALFGGRNVTDADNLSAAPQYHDQPKPAIEYVVVRAPEGWIVDRIEGSSYNGTFVLTPRERSVDVPAFDTKAPYRITFLNPELEEKLADLGSPSPGAWAALVALAAVVWAARRRA